MTKTFVLIIGLACATSALSQNLQPRELTPARGAYRALRNFSTQPKSADEDIDKEKFQYDPAAAERRLSLKPYYLENVTLEDFSIPEPPANSSEQTRAELNYLLSLQQQRTELDVTSSLYLAGVSYSLRVKAGDSTYARYRRNLFHIGRSIGSWFNPENLPVTADLIAHVWQDASYFIWSAKYKYQRIRPYKIETALNYLEETNWPAYPSGHAANSYVVAYIYQELAPEFTDTFVKDAFDMAHSREIIGVHYPSDSEASRVLARQIVNKLFENEKFIRDFEVARMEWAEKAKENFARPDVSACERTDEKKTSACAQTCQ